MTASTAIHPKGPRRASPGGGALNWVDIYLSSSVGRKILVAITGLLLGFYVFVHMIGNLKMFSGPESINKYAYFLKHDLGALIWIARGGLLLVFIVHLYLAIQLKLAAAAARPIHYANMRSAQASPGSKTMIWTGLVIGAFTLFHLAHYTFAVVHVKTAPDGTFTNYLDLKYQMPDGKMVHDVYSMVIAGFSTWWIAAFYIIAQLLLFMHLSHGLQSALITLGLVGKRFTLAAKLFGIALAGVILAGNLAIVIAVWCGSLK